MLMRNGRVEDVVLSWTLIPLSRIHGVYISLADVTEVHATKKRAGILSELEASCAAARDMQSLWTNTGKFLDSHPHHFPFALLFSLSSRPPSSSSANHASLEMGEGSAFHLQTSVGDSLDCAGEAIEACPSVQQALILKKPVLVTSEDEHFPKAWVNAPGKRGYGDPCDAAVICPILLSVAGNAKQVVGILVLGLHTRRPYNENYRSWVLQITQTLEGAATTVFTIEDDTEKKNAAAAKAAREQELLTKALASREREATALTVSYNWLQQVVELSDVGIFSFDLNGRLIEANDSWYVYSNHPKPGPGVDLTDLQFINLVYEDDIELAWSKWYILLKGIPVTFEMRWKTPAGSKEPFRWVLAACVPVQEDGVITSISGCTTDISAQKKFQKEALARAEALERAQASEKEANHASQSLVRMQFLVEQVAAGVFELTPEGVIMHSNDSYHTISGIPRAIVGVEQLAFANYLYPEDYEWVMENWRKMLGGEETTFEMRWKAPLNEYGEDFQWALAACVPVKDGSGKTTSIYGCLTNIGAQKRTERETRKRAEALERAEVSEQRFYRFTQSAPVAIYIANDRMELTYANDNWFDMTEHPRTAYEKVDWAGVVFEEDRETVTNAWADIFRGLQVNVQFRLNALWKGGDGPAARTWVMATALPEMEHGKLKQVIGTMTDISHLKFAESMQQLRIDQAVEAKRQTEAFIDTVSHEIRNPLSAVVHCADAISDSLAEMDVLVSTLMSSPVQDKAKQLHEYIEGSMDAASTITSCTSHQKRIVDDILVLSKLDSNLLHIAPVPGRALSILKDIDSMFEAEATRECINLFTKPHKSLEEMQVDWLLFDHGRINQILINLITNAIKFTKNRDVRNVTISMGVSEQRPSEKNLHVNFDVDFTLSQSMRDSIYDSPEYSENQLYLWFAVKDTGRGMTEEEKSRIFARFQQASPRTYSEYGGSGLGLYISHSLVGLQGGEIGVETSAGVGSTFAFFVKTIRCTAPEVKAAPKDTISEPTNTTKTNGTSKSVSVLIVEDNLLNQRVLKKQLSKNYEVHTADHGQEALDFLKTTRHWRETPSSDKHVDIILMDIEMPVMNGLNCATNIRELQRTGAIRGHIPIIAVSANARPEQTSQAIAAGMDDAISKPFRIPDLTPKIDRLVSWSRGK
ncbi:hypothetical protein MBLNU459_g0026t2 [Dothideomycetes sp. NU459]